MNPDLTQAPIDPVNAAGFSFLNLFLHASPVVQFVMVGLLLASVWSWAIIIEKLFAFRKARREVRSVRADVLVRPVAG